MSDELAQIDTRIICPDCGQYMCKRVEQDRIQYIYCANTGCMNYEERYKPPTMQLEKIVE